MGLRADTDAVSVDPLLLDELPALPGAALELLSLWEDPDAGVADAAEVVRREPALAARVIQTANSPMYAPREPVTDVTRAASILGLRSMTLLGVGFLILDDLWGEDVPVAPLTALMGAGTMAASAARTFATRMGADDADGLATAALLSFVGELALLRVRPDHMAALWEAHGRMPSVDEQHAVLGTDGVVVGSKLMQRWGLPEDLSDGVRIRSLSVAERLAQQDDRLRVSLGFGTAVAELLTGGGGVLAALREPAAQWGMGDDQLLRFWADFRGAAADTVAQLGVGDATAVARAIDVAEADYRRWLAALESEAVEAEEVDVVPERLVSELHSARREIETLREENDRLEDLSMQDPLTGAPNRLAFETHLRSALSQLQRDVAPATQVGVAMFDLDHFKDVNDTDGHLVGDQLLSAVSSAGLRAARQNELFARIGGDEFAMILRPRDDVQLGHAVERVRQAMCAGAQREGGVSTQTVSAGAASLGPFTVDVDAAARLLIQAADDALYASKRAGRNRTSVGTPIADGLTVGPFAAD